MLKVEKLCASAENCLGWPYASPGTNDARGIDCSGLLVRCFRDQGASIYHGSNTIYRKYCSEKGPLTSVSQLRPGMAVFKWNPDTPAKFNDGLGDFQHTGLVTSISPLRIIHASSAAGCVTCDKALGKWKYWGWLKDVAKDEKAAPASPVSSPDQTDAGTSTPTFSAPETDAASRRVKVISSGGKVNIRKGNATSYARITAVSPGTMLEYIATAENGWHAVKSGKQVGWICGDFAELIFTNSR